MIRPSQSARKNESARRLSSTDFCSTNGRSSASHDSFSFDGKYFQARELTVVPRPVQTPHPPVRIAANSPDTFPLAARQRLPIFASPLISSRKNSRPA
jgi:alkanesulfonate monooxygenase SsuD/methylene tetrahydromethanopterin reductase-like flavin-dependent oxidoreductase (luciferase family)